MERLSISTVHLNSLGMVHEFRLIAAIDSFSFRKFTAFYVL